MKNRLIDVHNNLMATLEDLDNEDLLDDKEKLHRLCSIAKAKAMIAREIVNVDRLGYAAVASGDNNLLNTDLLKIED